MRAEDGLIERLEVTTGVWLGKIFSLLLFILLLNDADVYFLSQGARGISLSYEIELISLTYADKIVPLSDSPAELRRKLILLAKYCKEKSLEVNENKNHMLRESKEYEYLESLVSLSGVIFRAAQSFIGKVEVDGGRYSTEDSAIHTSWCLGR